MIRRGLVAALALSLPGTGAAQNVAEVQVAPPSITIRVGERSGLLATAFDRIGNVIPTVRIIWSSNNINIAKVDNNGTVTGIGNGVAIIEARVASRRGQAAVQVTGGSAPAPPPPPPPPPGAPPAPPGPDPFAGQPAGSGPAAALRLEPGVIYLLASENTRVSPRALREDGSPAAPVLVTWTSLRSDVASVDQSGNVVALSPGQGTIQATATGGLTATAPVVVQQAEYTVREGSPLKLSPGEVDTLHVIVAAQNNRTVNPLVLQWASSDQSVARISLGGVVTAAGPGKAILTVSGLLQSKNIDVSVHPIVEKLSVRPTVYADDQGNVLGPATSLTWSSDNPQVATVGEDGTVSGTGYGHAHSTAAAPGGKSAAADVYVVGEIIIASSRTAGKFQLYAAERSNLAQLTKLTPDTSSATDPAFSPDGSRIAYVSQRDGNAEIYVMNADGTGAVRVTNDPQPDG